MKTKDDFKVGDSVTVVNGGIELSLCHDAKRFNGLTGKVNNVGLYIGVIFDERIGKPYGYDFFPHELEHTPKEPMNTFKVGDTVESHSMAECYRQFNGIRGTIIKDRDSYGMFLIKSDYEAKYYGGQELCFKPENLRLIESQPTEFKVGDRVKSDSRREGYVSSINQMDTRKKTVGVRYDDHYYSSDTDRHTVDIGRLTLLSPHSPQPQTTEPKEEDNMKPYAVIYHSLTSGAAGTINSTHTTEAEAKEHAESLVAGQRANLTHKAYFTITIVNTKTGELVGSVTDAPPAVDWNAGK